MFNMDTLLQIVGDNWIVLAVGLAILWIILRFVKTIIKWVFVIIIIVGLLLYCGITPEQISDKVENVVDLVKNKDVAGLIEEVKKILPEESEKATYKSEKDGEFSITSPDLLVESVPDQPNKVKITYKSIPLGEWEMNDLVRTFIDKVKEK